MTSLVGTAARLAGYTRSSHAARRGAAMMEQRQGNGSSEAAGAEAKATEVSWQARQTTRGGPEIAGGTGRDETKWDETKWDGTKRDGRNGPKCNVI